MNPKSNPTFSVKKRLLSFTHAWRGLKTLLTEEHNSRIHLFFAFAAIFFGFFFAINLFEWIAILFCIGFVFAMELVNSAIENICDLIHLEHHPIIGKIKDLMAGAVLVSAWVAVGIGLLIFLPKIWV